MEKKKSYLLHKVLAALLIGTTLVSGGIALGGSAGTGI